MSPLATPPTPPPLNAITSSVREPCGGTTTPPNFPQFPPGSIQPPRNQCGEPRVSGEVPRNQCDGCCAGIPVDHRGIHLFPHRIPPPKGLRHVGDLMVCQAHRYTPEPECGLTGQRGTENAPEASPATWDRSAWKRAAAPPERHPVETAVKAWFALASWWLPEGFGG
jgi:hypothetical protein